MTQPFLPGQRLAAGRLELMRRPPACSVLNPSSQSVPSSILTFTALQAPFQEFDSDGMHNPAVNNTRITAQTAGTYLVSANVGFNAAGSSPTAVLWFRVNGVDPLSMGMGIITSSLGVPLSAVRQFELAEGDYVEVGASHNVGSSHAVFLRQFAVVRLGAF